jgi:hypothetical protein
MVLGNKIDIDGGNARVVGDDGSCWRGLLETALHVVQLGLLQ